MRIGMTQAPPRKSIEFWRPSLRPVPNLKSSFASTRPVPGPPVPPSGFGATAIAFHGTFDYSQFDMMSTTYFDYCQQTM